MGQIRGAPAKIKLSDHQRHELEVLAAAGPYSQRAKAILMLDKGIPSPQVAPAIGCSVSLVSVWRRAYAEGGVEKLKKPMGLWKSSHQPLNLTSTERATLQSWAADPGGPAGRDVRARFILLYDEGATAGKIERRLGLSRNNSYYIGRRFTTHRLDGIDRPRRSSKLTAEAAATKHAEQIREDREEDARRKTEEVEAAKQRKQRGDPLVGERDFLARAGLDAAPPLPTTISSNQQGRPDWSRMSKGGGERYGIALAKRVAAVIGGEGTITLFQISAGTRFQGHVEWAEPLWIPEEDVVRVIVRAARISKSLRRDSSWGNAVRLAELHDLTIGDVAREGAKWDGVNRREAIFNAPDRPPARTLHGKPAKRTSTGSDADAS